MSNEFHMPQKQKSTTVFMLIYMYQHFKVKTKYCKNMLKTEIPTRWKVCN